MNVGILFAQAETAAMIASWLQLGRHDWEYLGPDSKYWIRHTGRLILTTPAIRHHINGKVLAHAQRTNRVLMLLPLGNGRRLVVRSILDEASKQGIELTLEEARHFAAVGHVVLDNDI